MKKDKTLESVFSDSFVKVVFRRGLPSDEKQNPLSKKKLAELFGSDPSMHKASDYLFPEKINSYFRKYFVAFETTVFKPLSYPWSDGDTNSSQWRIIPNDKVTQLEKLYKQHKAMFEKAVDSFCENYDWHIENAKKKLGEAFDINNYDDVETFRAKFKMSIQFGAFESVSFSNDARIQLSAEQRQMIENQVASNFKETHNMIAKEQMDRLTEALDNVLIAMDKEGNKGSFFKRAVFDNLKSKVEDAQSINDKLLRSKKLSGVISQVTATLTKVSNGIESLKGKDDLAVENRESMKEEITSAKKSLNDSIFGGLMGGDNE